jgi:hypothetical protein
VLINGTGPYRLVLDSGASRSAIWTKVDTELGLADRTYKRPYVGSGTGRGELQSGG